MTVFNYFPSKEDLVYSGLEAFEDQLLAAVRDRLLGQTVIAAFGDFILEPRGLLAAKDDAAARELIAVTRMIAASPALLAREQQIFARYTDTLAQLIADETGARAGDQRPYVVANALIGVHRALIFFVRDRLAAGASDRGRLARQVRQRGENALTLLGDGLGDYAPKRQRGAQWPTLPSVSIDAASASARRSSSRTRGEPRCSAATSLVRPDATDGASPPPQLLPTVSSS